MKNYLSVPFRRHTSDCSRQYDRNKPDQEIREPDPGRSYQKWLNENDCSCPLVVNGRLKNEVDENGKEKRLRYISTGFTDWKTANEVREKWITWQGFTPPVDPDNAPKKSVTVEVAVSRFLKSIGPAGTNLDRDTLRKYTVLLKLRLLTFCEKHDPRIKDLQAFDEKPTCEDFFLSWVNLNPHENKKGRDVVLVPLGDSTKIAELTNFRSFLNYCVESGWLDHNWAKKLKVKKHRVGRKHGLTLKEYDRVEEAMALYTDQYGRPGQINAQRLLVFVRLMRYAGLRVSDATTFHRSQLIRRASGNGWAVHIVYYDADEANQGQKKTGTDAYIPIEDDLADALLALPFRCTKDGESYWFWTGIGKIKTGITTWRRTITNLLNKVQQKDKSGNYLKPFEHYAQPTHVFRHTFAIIALNEGTPIGYVSSWLGHSSVAVTSRHYSHANSETQERSDVAYDKMMNKLRKRKADVGAAA